MEREDKILAAIDNLRVKVTEIHEDLRGNGGFNEGLIPAFKRHTAEDKVMEITLNEKLEDIHAKINTISPQKKIGIWKWIEEHPNTMKYILIAYILVFHIGLAAKLLKLI